MFQVFCGRSARRGCWSQSGFKTLPGALQVVCAGSLDTFQVFVWAVRTARLLDVLAAHEGPVVALAFSPAAPLLASGSWDRTVRTWDVFRRAQ